MTRSHFHSNRNRDLVLDPVNDEGSVDLDIGRSGRRDVSLQPVGAEDDIGITRALQHVLLHFVVAPVISALASRGIDQNLAAQFVGCRIEMDRAALELEATRVPNEA